MKDQLLRLILGALLEAHGKRLVDCVKCTDGQIEVRVGSWDSDWLTCWKCDGQGATVETIKPE